jgi:hypothetical protein
MISTTKWLIIARHLAIGHWPHWTTVQWNLVIFRGNISKLH